MWAWLPAPPPVQLVVSGHHICDRFTQKALAFGVLDFEECQGTHVVWWTARAQLKPRHTAQRLCGPRSSARWRLPGGGCKEGGRRELSLGEGGGAEAYVAAGAEPARGPGTRPHTARVRLLSPWSACSGHSMRRNPAAPGLLRQLPVRTVYACTPAHVHTQTPAHPHTCSSAHLHTCAPTPAHTCTPVPAHTRAPTHPHTCVSAPPFPSLTHIPASEAPSGCSVLQ